MRSFVDTNVLVYAHDLADPDKHDTAVRLLAATPPSDLVISAQVLSEFFVVVTRTGRELLSPARASEVVLVLSRTTVEAVDADLVRRALRLRSVASISYWDALIVEAAARAGCERILTEDLSHGDRLSGVVIENPFAR